MKTLAVIVFSLSFILTGSTTQAQVGVSVQIGIAPPALPVYVQPACPVEGYMWTPGYWAYGPRAYYWVPGVWVAPPRVGVLWTPGYWGFERGAYFWHRGYWGPHIGFYGGVHYGFGYDGVGFHGGVWNGGRFRYNTAVCNVNATIVHNTYVDRTVVNTYNGPRTSFNGQGGVNAQPSPEEQNAGREQHVEPTSAQTAHEQTASTNRNQLASVNGGHPNATAMSSVNGQRYSSTGHSINSTASSHPNANGVSRSNTNSNRQMRSQRVGTQSRRAPSQSRGGRASRGGGTGGGRRN